MRLLKLFGFLTSIIICSNHYDGYKLIKCTVSDSKELTQISNLLEDENLGIELWDKLEGGVFYLVLTPDSVEDALKALYGINTEILVNDLQDLLDGKEQKPMRNDKENTNISKREATMNHTIYNDSIFDDYQNYDSLMTYLLEQPDAVEFQIGKTYNEIPIRGVKVGSGPKNIVITGGMHGACRLTSSTATYIASYLMSDSTNADSFRERFTFHIIPVLNPDGYEYSLNENVKWHKNRQPTKEPEYIGIDLQYIFGFKFLSGFDASDKSVRSKIYM